MKLDLSKFSQSKQEFNMQNKIVEDTGVNRPSSGSNNAGGGVSSSLNQFTQQRGSISSNKASRRQGTPVSQIALTGNSH